MKKYVPLRMDEKTITELDAMKKKLKVRGRSELIREAVDQYLRSDQPLLKKDTCESLEAWRKEFHGVGSNLNQIAYRMNADHPLSSRDIKQTLADLQEQFKGLATNMKRMRNDLGI